MSREPRRSDPVAESTDIAGGGVDAHLIIRLLVGLVAAVLAVLFIVQNSKMVELSFVFFTVTTRVWVGLIVALVLGALLGQLLLILFRRRRRSHAAE